MKAERWSKSIALLFLYLQRQMGWVVNATPRPLYTRERPGTYCIGGWVGPRAGLDGCRKSRLNRDSIPGPFSSQRDAILTVIVILKIHNFCQKGTFAVSRPGHLKTQQHHYMGLKLSGNIPLRVSISHLHLLGHMCGILLVMQVQLKCNIVHALG